MTVLNTGSTKKYSENWARVFQKRAAAGSPAESGKLKKKASVTSAGKKKSAAKARAATSTRKTPKKK
jgi:hypothetical protein